MSGDLESRALARVGSVLHGKYRLDALLGVGAAAAVYRATHRNGLRVAAKVLHAHHAGDDDLRARFLREGYAANRVDHPGAVRVLDDDTAADGSVFLVMELLEGQTVDALWQGSSFRLSQDFVCELAGQLLDVLVAAHAKGVVHRDVKPDNLFLADGGVLKVLDFGIARVLERRESAAETLAGRRFGTPGYMAPEQALGRAGDIDGQSDLWGTAATMYTLLSGQLVHEAETVEEVLIRAGTEPARPVRSIVPDLAPPVAEAIDRALAFDKQDRWPDAAAMREALAGAVTASLGETLPIDLLRRVHPVRSTPPRRVRRRRSGAILFPLAVAAIVAGATVAMPKTHATWSSWTAGWKQALVTHSPARALSRHR